MNETAVTNTSTAMSEMPNVGAVVPKDETCMYDGVISIERISIIGHKNAHKIFDRIKALTESLLFFIMPVT